MGWGQLQPFTHWQKFNPDTNTDTRQIDVGVNYVIDGFNAQLTAMYTNTKVTSSKSLDKFVLALQLQY